MEMRPRSKIQGAAGPGLIRHEHENLSGDRRGRSTPTGVGRYPISSKLWEARSRLDRSRLLQVSTNVAAFLMSTSSAHFCTLQSQNVCRISSPFFQEFPGFFVSVYYAVARHFSINLDEMFSDFCDAYNQNY